MDGTIKSDEESRVSIKCATLTCLSHLSTIDPFAFFDSFDYPTESMFWFFKYRRNYIQNTRMKILKKISRKTVSERVEFVSILQRFDRSFLFLMSK